VGEAISKRRGSNVRKQKEKERKEAKARERIRPHRQVGNGIGPIKKIPYRVATGFAREAQYRVIEHLRGKHEVKAMCAFFGVSRAAYYAWRIKSSGPDRDQVRMKLVEEAFIASRCTYGYRRIAIWIRQRKGENINPKAVLRLMNKLGIHSIARKRNPYRIPKAQQNFHCYPHLLKRNFHAEKPNQKWCTDITYIRTQTGWAYLSVIKDLFDGYIVAHHLSSRNDVALVTNTLKHAYQKELVTGTLIHSDQGHQYCSHAYYVLTKDYRLIPSMSRKANCWDNAPIESFFGFLKEEALRQYPALTFLEAKQVIDEYIYFYNYERIQLKTKQTPYHLRSLFT
jgi:putative transposase